MNDLWSDILRGPTECSGGTPRSNANLTQTEVCNLNVALYVQHDVVQFEVPVDHSVLVEEHDGDADFGSVESEDKRERKVEQSRVTSSAQLTWREVP